MTVFLIGATVLAFGKNGALAQRAASCGNNSKVVYDSALCSSTLPIVVSAHPELPALARIHENVLGANVENGILTPAYLMTYAASMKTIGIRASRYPGGQIANVWEWQDYAPGAMPEYCNRTSAPRYATGDVTAFMKDLAVPDNESVEMQVDYENGGWVAPSKTWGCDKPGDPQHAAALVSFLESYGPHRPLWWEVGNEEYLGANDSHTVENGWPHGPKNAVTYCSNGAEPTFYTDMKAVDPAINIGISVIGNPTAYPGNEHVYWDPYVLANCKFDYVNYHYYPLRPPHLTDENTLAAPIAGKQSVSNQIGSLRRELAASGKCTLPCTNYPISVSEWNSTPFNPGPQSNSIVQALFVAETLGEMFNLGITRADYFALAQCNNRALSSQPKVYSWQTDIAQQGLVSLPLPVAYYCSPASETYANGQILPAGWAFSVFGNSGFATDGSKAISVDQPQDSIRTYVSEHGGTYVAILINLDPTMEQNVSFRIDGVKSGTSLGEIRYSKAIYDRSINNGPLDPPTSRSLGSWSLPMNLTLPPYSITAYSFSATSPSASHN